MSTPASRTVKDIGKACVYGEGTEAFSTKWIWQTWNPCASTCLLSICRQTCSWVSQTYKNKWGPFLLYTEAVLNNLRSTIFIYMPRSDTFFCALQFYSLLIHLDLIWTYLISNLRKTAKEQIDYDLLQLWVKNQYYPEEKRKGRLPCSGQ